MTQRERRKSRRPSSFACQLETPHQFHSQYPSPASINQDATAVVFLIFYLCLRWQHFENKLDSKSRSKLRNNRRLHTVNNCNAYNLSLLLRCHRMPFGGVDALLGSSVHEFTMGSTFHNGPVFHHSNMVGETASCPSIGSKYCRCPGLS
jgi:hypothetical protein